MKKAVLLLTQIIVLLSTISSIKFAQSWTQLGRDIDGEALGDQSSVSVSLSSDGMSVAIGAWNNDGTGTNAGHVRVYSESEGEWTQIGSDIDGEAADDRSGISVSLSSDGKRVAIGATRNDGNGNEAGHVRIYSESGGVWTQLGSDIDGEAADDNSGFSVSLSSDGKRIAIGAHYNDGTDPSAGHVRIYSESEGTWTQVGSDIDGEAAGDYSGFSVSLSYDGKRIAIGASENAGASIYTYAGHVRVYSESGDAWTQVGSDIDAEAERDWSGWSVSLSSDGKRVAIGANQNDGNGNEAGHVRVYSESGGVWTQLGSDIDGEAADDRSGTSVSLSSYGKRVAIGATRNDGNGNNAGHVRVYSESEGVWTQIGSDIDGEAVDDGSGYSVALSSDGSKVVIGAPYNDGTGSFAGHARIYTYETAIQVDYKNPESAVYDDTNDCYYVSNTGDGKIIRVDANDTNSKSVLNSDLTSVRGLCIIGNMLVAAADEGVVFIALPIGTIIQTIVIPGMLFLNDVTWDDSQYVYVSDTQTGMIYKVKTDDYTYSTLAVGINSPNGLFYDGANNRLICVSMIPNAPILVVSLSDGTVTTLKTTTLSNPDGIARNMFGEWYISYWGDNSVYRFNSDFSGNPVEVSSSHAGPADISFRTLTVTGKVSNAIEIQANTGILVIPNFNGNTVNFLNLTNLSNYESEIYIPQYFSLKQNYPNPFNPNTTIYYSLPDESVVTITVYDVLGKEINQLISQIKPQGNHSVGWNGNDNFGNPVSAGIYLYQILTVDFVQTKKMVLMR